VESAGLMWSTWPTRRSSASAEDLFCVVIPISDYLCQQSRLQVLGPHAFDNATPGLQGDETRGVCLASAPSNCRDLWVKIF
jgi:hypothetical protein